MHDSGHERSAAGHVFIVTYGRSGSTILQKVLNSIEGYQIRGENNNALFYLAQSWHAIKTSGPMAGLRSSGNTSDPSHPWYGAENVDPDEYGAEISRLFTKTILRPSNKARIIGFKEIRFSNQPNLFPMYLDFIHKYFINTKFIFNLRAHDDVIRSGWWKNMDPEKARQHLVDAETLYYKYMDKHPDRGVVVRYDDYIRDVSSLKPLFDFIGEPLNEKSIIDILKVRLSH